MTQAALFASDGSPLDFSGTYEEGTQPTHQRERIFLLMRDGHWRTLDEIAAATYSPAASVSAQLRHLRKPKHGAHIVAKRHRGEGIFEYQLIENPHAGGKR